MRNSPVHPRPWQFPLLGISPPFLTRDYLYNNHRTCPGCTKVVFHGALPTALGLLIFRSRAGKSTWSGKVGRMQAIGSYLVVEYMIRQKKILLFELRHLVASLERRDLITPKEYETLLRLGKKILPKLPTDPC